MTDETYRTQEFLNKYKELEDSARLYFANRKQKSESPIIDLESEFPRIAGKIRFVRSCRNALTHENIIFLGEYGLCATNELIDTLDSVIREITSSKKVQDRAIMGDRVFSAHLSDHVLESMRVMDNNAYTHIPILDNEGHVIGVFSESSLFFAIMNENGMILDENTKFADIFECLKISNDRPEKFYFTKPTTKMVDIYSAFQKAVSNMIRIGMVFITTSGNESGVLLGIITPWDIV